MKKCYIVGGGNFHPEIFPKNKINNDDLIIAADSGYEYLKQMNIIPDLCIGDFDSLGYIPDNCPILKLPEEKDDTDISAAIKEGFKKNYKEFELYGVLGGSRISHSVANIQLLLMTEKMGGHARIIDKNITIYSLSDGTYNYSDKEKGNISVMSLTEKIKVEETGLKYYFNGYMENSFPLGVSNRFVGRNSQIKVSEGTALIIIEK